MLLLLIVYAPRLRDLGATGRERTIEPGQTRGKAPPMPACGHCPPRLLGPANKAGPFFGVPESGNEQTAIALDGKLPSSSCSERLPVLYRAQNPAGLTSDGVLL